MHGDLDQVVTIESFLEAKDFFGKHNYEIETKIFKNCEHRIPTEGSSLGLQFIKKHFKLYFSLTSSINLLSLFSATKDFDKICSGL